MLPVPSFLSISYLTSNLAAAGTRERGQEDKDQDAIRLDKMKNAVRTLLECIGENPDREGLLNTPLRYSKALLFLTEGYQVDVKASVNNALFHEDHSEMVTVRDVAISSLCEHHLVPFTGKESPPFLRLFYYILDSRKCRLTSFSDAHWVYPLWYRYWAL